MFLLLFTMDRYFYCEILIFNILALFKRPDKGFLRFASLQYYQNFALCIVSKRFYYINIRLLSVNHIPQLGGTFKRNDLSC